jgi:hypothetical protein
MSAADDLRIKRLAKLCDQIDSLRKQANEIRKLATEELERHRRDGIVERRNQEKRVRRDRRHPR